MPKQKTKPGRKASKTKLPVVNWLPILENINSVCACPICGSEYSLSELACQHQLCDWCFSMDVDPGWERGNWPTKAGNRVLARFDKAMHTLSDMLDNWEWPSDEAHATIRDALPEHLRDEMGGSWGSLLDERIAAAPSYFGTHQITTESMASDSWSVHWATNARVAARPVIVSFREDLAVLEPIIRRAKKIAKS